MTLLLVSQIRRKWSFILIELEFEMEMAPFSGIYLRAKINKMIKVKVNGKWDDIVKRLVSEDVNGFEFRFISITTNINRIVTAPI